MGMDEMIRDAPAPGTYDPTLPADLRKHNIRHAAFRSKDPRLPKWGSLVPGPGEYNPVKPSMRNKNFALGSRGSSSFANKNTDRFGVPFKRKVDVPDPNPGPGAYTPEYTPSARKNVSSSW